MLGPTSGLSGTRRLAYLNATLHRQCNNKNRWNAFACQRHRRAIERASSLVVKLQRELHQSRASGLADLTEGSIESVAVRVQELRVIKGVEQFCAKLKRLALAQLRPLEKRNIPVVYPGATNGVPA